MSDDVKVDQLPKIELVFMYRYLHPDGSVRWVWGKERNDSGYTEQIYKGKRGKNIAPHAAVGAVYSFPDAGDSIYTGSNASFLRQLDDDELKTEWKCVDRAGQQAILAQREMKKLARQDALRDALAPLRRAYEYMNARDRAQFIAWATRYIVEGK